MSSERGVITRWLMDATRRRAELGAELRKARDHAGLTQKQAATFLGCTQSKITKIETAASDVKPHDLERLLRLYDPSEALLLKIKTLAALPSPGLTEIARRPHAAYVRLLDKEPRASVVLALHSERIPCPLQSNPYRLKQYQLAGDSTAQAVLMLDRNHRAEIFTDPARTTRYRVLLSESALHRLPGGRTPDLLVDQAKYLLELTERYERLSLQIVTFTADIPFMDADFTVLKFSDPKDDVAYVDTNIDAQLIEGTQRVADREKYWHRVQRAALSTEDSKKFLHGLMDAAETEMAADNV